MLASDFLYDLPVVSISIAATIDSTVVAGAVADVHHAETFSAAIGTGARRSTAPITASTPDSLDEALIATGFSYDARLRAQQAERLADLLPSCRDIRCMGSAALNLCWVACGRLDGYYERDLNLKEVGEVLGVSESRVCQIHSQALLRLRSMVEH